MRLREKLLVNTPLYSCLQRREGAHKGRRGRRRRKVGAGREAPGWAEGKGAGALETTPGAAGRRRRRLVGRGFQGVLEHGNRGSRKVRRLDGAAEAHLIALACGASPAGRKRWTVRLLADQMVALGYVDSCGKSTVHDTLKKTSLSLT